MNTNNQEIDRLKAEIFILREGIDFLLGEIHQDWKNLKSGDKFPLISSMAVHDTLCDVIEDANMIYEGENTQKAIDKHAARSKELFEQLPKETQERILKQIS